MTVLRARRWLLPLAAIMVGLIALRVLHGELSGHHLHDITVSIAALSRSRIALAFLLTTLSFCVLFGYDVLALRYIRRRLSLKRIAFASFVGYAVSQLLSFTALTGGSVRYRVWSARGLSGVDVAQAVAFDIAASWLGILTVAGAALLLSHDLPPEPLLSHASVRVSVGIALLTVVLGYMAWNALARGRALRVNGWCITPPGTSLAVSQLALATLDWAVAGSVLYVLLPSGSVPPTAFFQAYMLAQVAGIVSQLPGGIGVLESVLVVLLRPYVSAPNALAAIIAYRAVYYLLPFCVAAMALAAYELRQRRLHETWLVRAAWHWLPTFLPDALSILTFGAGIVLLVSGATPALSSRLVWLDSVLPIGVIETSHFVGSIVGVALLILARGIRRRLDAAYHLTAAALVVGIVASLLKGADYEEALALTIVLGLMIPARRHFYRRAALMNDPWSPGWIVAIVLVLAATMWLGFFSYRHVAYSGELWWQFTLHGDAPRFLRATAGVVGVMLAYALARLLGPSRPSIGAPSRADIDRAGDIAYESGNLEAYLGTLGDKALLFAGTSGLLMYAVSGRTWVVLGDPIGTPQERADLAWRFKEMADRYVGWPVFYEASGDSLPLFVEMGLTLLKIGEEARVPLDSFCLDGSEHRELRRTVRRVERADATFEIVPSENVPALLPELRRVSDSWLTRKNTREKGFSLGRFDEPYLRRFPVAVVRSSGRVVAFANVWPSATHEELSVDLMRHDPEAPSGVMEYALIQLMLWGKNAGYRWFNLGMAPLAGLPNRSHAPRWSTVGGLLYRRGGHFYNFRGLRDYKAKFDPVWEPRYLASPGGLALPRILADIATLIGGGIRGTVAR